MKKVLLIINFCLIFACCTLSASSQVLQFFTGKEGLEAAKSNSSYNSPQLIAFMWSNQAYVPNIPVIGTLMGEMKFSGSDIGKANVWVYIFRDGNNSSKYEQVAVIKLPELMGGFTVVSLNNFDLVELLNLSTKLQIDDTELVDSDIFVSNLVQNPDYINYQTIIDPNQNVSYVGVVAMKQAMLGMEAEKLYWVSDTWDPPTYTDYACSADYTTGTPVTCMEAVDEIDEITSTPNIEIYPNPTSHNINIIASSDIIINSLEMFDMAGNFVCSFDIDSRKLDLSKHSNGKYYVCVTSNMRKYYYPVVISK